MRQGLYKVNFHTVHGTGCGVVYVTDGKMRGGNSAFAFIGTYVGEGDSIKVKISTPALQRRSVLQAAVRARQNHADAGRP
ncbi:hypothetical protein [Bradyrhizobium barranii]